MHKYIIYIVVKKTLFLLVFIAMCFSCSNETVIGQEPEMNHSSSVYEPDYGYYRLGLSLDSLNMVYKDSAVVTRGSMANYFLIRAADTAGRHAGGAIGSWIGSAVGAALANPVTAVGGYLGGRMAGRFIGGCAASYIAMRVLENALVATNTLGDGLVFPNPNNDYVMINGGLVIQNPGFSYGKIHNDVMLDVVGNVDSILKGNQVYYDGDINVTTIMPQLDYEEMYTDCINSLKENGVYDDTLFNDPNYKKFIIDFSIKAADLVKQCINGEISEDDLFDIEALLLSKECKVDSNEVKIFKTFGRDIAKGCGDLSVPQVKNYARDLNKVILASPLPDSLKMEVVGVADIVVNSTICWTDKK